MIEDENPVPPTAISNSGLAEDMAYAEKPYWELAKHAKELGVDHVASQMDIQATEAAKAIVEGYRADPANSIEVQVSEPAAVIEAPSPEKKISPERLSEMMRNSAVGTNAWMTAREVPSEKRERSGGSYMTVGTSERVRGLTEWPLRIPGSDELLGQFRAQNVSEVVTTQETTWDTKSMKPESAKPDEPLVVVTYQTTNKNKDRTGPRYVHQTASAGDGNFITTCLFMPKSDAEELLIAMQTDPGIIRDAVEIGMRQEVEAPTTWEQMKPPYDKWREANGGVDRIALRNSFEAGPGHAQILEF